MPLAQSELDSSTYIELKSRRAKFRQDRKMDQKQITRLMDA